MLGWSFLRTREQLIGRGRFEVRATLGTGAFGTVLAAFDRERGHLVAIKRPHLHAAESLYRFKQEFRALADLSHPNLVGLHELFEDAGHWFFTMELVDGVPLTSYLRHALGEAAEDEETLAGTSFDALGRTQGGPSCTSEPGGAATVPPPRRAASPGPPPLPDLERLRCSFAQVSRALLCLHAAHMLHRDIKPSNILVTAAGRVVVLDFGLVRREHHHPGSDDSVVGTPLYMAPEQWLGEPVGAAADWYSVGVMLYEALLGEPPFRGDLLTLMQAKSRDEFVWPRARCPEVPPDLDALCRELLRADAGARPPGPAVLHRLAGELEGAPGSPSIAARERVFVGRERELAALRAAHAGPLPMLLHLSGEPGIGKTALCEAFLAGVAARGGCVLRGRCFEQESVPYKALDAVIDELSQELRRRDARELARLLPPEAGLLARTFPVLEKIVGARDGGDNLGADFNPVALRGRAFAALRELLRRMTAAGPLVLSIDDLQWGDAESAAIVHSLLRPPDPPALLLLLSYRDEGDPGPFLRELRALTAEAGALPCGPTIALGRLSQAEGHALVTALGPAATSPRRRERVVRESAGIPLLLEQLAQAVPGDSCDPDLELGDDGPDLLARLLARQLAELPPEARRVLELVAVAGVPLRLDLLAAAAGLPAIDRAIVQPLCARHLVRLSETASERRLAPSYGQIAATVAAGLAPEQRRASHLALAEALAGSDAHAAAPRLIATHYHAAGELAAAGEHIRRAAEQAAAALAFEEAAACYGLALAWQPGDAASQRRLRRGRADALVNAGRCREAAPLYLGLVEDAAPLAAIELRRLAAEQLLGCGDLDAGEAQLRRLIDEQGLGYPESPGRATLALAYGLVRIKLRGTQYTPRGPCELDPAALAAIDTCLSASRNLALVRTLYSMLFGIKALRLALDAGERGRIVEALAAVGGGLALTGDAHGRDLFEQAEALAELISTPRARGLVALWKGFQRFGAGDWAASRALWEASGRLLGECPGHITELLRADAYVLLALMHLGEYRELALRTEALMASARATGNLYTEVTALMYSALPRLAADDLRGARARIAAAEARSPRDSWNGLSRMKLHVQCALYGGDAAAGLARLEAAQPEIEASRLRSFGIFRVVVGGLHAGTALQVLADGAAPQRRALLRTARRELARFADEPMAFAQGIAHWLRAALASAEGDAAAAVSHCEAAVRSFEAGACWAEAACTRRRLGQLLGGSEGQARIAAADATLRSRGVADPVRWTACFAPGLADPP